MQSDQSSRGRLTQGSPRHPAGTADLKECKAGSFIQRVLPSARQRPSCRGKAVTMTAMVPARMEPPVRRERHQTGELSKRKGQSRLLQVGGFMGEGREGPGGGERPGGRHEPAAVSHTTPGAGTLVSVVPRSPKGAASPRSQMPACSRACQGNGTSGELTFRSPSSQLSGMCWGYHPCLAPGGQAGMWPESQNSWEGTGRDEKAKAASGDCNREDEGHC